MAEHYSYILRCSDGSLYSGYTVAPERRLKEHNSGTASRYTRSRRPVTMEALWLWQDKRTALRAERAVKRLPRSQKEELIQGRRALVF
ncbi:MAG: GIY-YIG nuclease family protein [Pyramidobacter sp.]|nr:GIY-YIG nuclease family protein [Pyramidobacter sp.]